MAQINVQVQNLQQTQTLSPQQVMLVRMLELPVQELEQRVHTELMENVALEEGKDEYEKADDELSETKSDEPDDLEGTSMGEAHEADGIDAILSDSEDDDYNTLSTASYKSSATPIDDIPFSEATSFYEQLKEQIGECNLKEGQQDILEYLIGSLEDDGLLHKELSRIADELAIYQNIDVDEAELEECLHMLQQFDPAGIGARNLQECLLLQIDRKKSNPLRAFEHEVIAHCMEEFKGKRWDKIAAHLNIAPADLERVKSDLEHLNPRPGFSMGEALNRNFQTIIPDFIVEVDEDGTIHLQLNNGDLPELHVSSAFVESLKAYNSNKDKMSKRAKEELAYTKQKIDHAQTFIDVIRQRHHTLTVTMQAIIDLQKAFFREGDDTLLRPMILKDVAERAGLDISTVSRVSNSKYVQTPWGMFSLKHFFNDGYTTDSGEDISTRVIRQHLQEIIDGEDKDNPYTDEQLAELLKKQGYDMARRTVAKYRTQLNIPIARLRR